MGQHSGTLIDIIRHGEPEGGRMFRGSGTDHPLSATGWQQMHYAISQHFLRLGTTAPWELIISSPMLRCQDFARVLACQLNIPLLITHELTEIHFGDWEGKSAVAIQALNPELYYNYQNDPFTHRPSGAESLQTFNTRIMNAIYGIFEEYPKQRILLIGHGGVMRTILSEIVSASLIKRQCVRFPYAAMMCLYQQHDQMRLEFL